MPAWFDADDAATAPALNVLLNGEFEVSRASLWRASSTARGERSSARGQSFDEFLTSVGSALDGVFVRPGSLLPLGGRSPGLYGDDVFYSLFLLQRAARVGPLPGFDAGCGQFKFLDVEVVGGKQPGNASFFTKWRRATASTRNQRS